jgi:hypothetical protein
VRSKRHYNAALALLRCWAAGELAERIPNAEGKLTLLAKAQSWLALAEQAVKNSETVLVYETPMPKQIA